jgi:hypothetical protein
MRRARARRAQWLALAGEAGPGGGADPLTLARADVTLADSTLTLADTEA